jgi:hypothetical protein
MLHSLIYSEFDSRYVELYGIMQIYGFHIASRIVEMQLQLSMRNISWLDRISLSKWQKEKTNKIFRNEMIIL